MIVGAGPYGLSIGAHLRAAKLRFAMFGTPLDSWRKFMPEGMVLKSEPFASNLWDPHRRFTLEHYFRARKYPYQPIGSPLSIVRFLEYADWFRHNTIDEPEDVRVVKIQRVVGGFTLTLTDHRVVTSRRVILATGHMPFRLMPQEFAHLPEPQVVHSSRMGDVRRYAGHDVTVVGAGQSALESAALLHEAGAQVRLIARRSRIDWNGPSKPRPLLQRILRPDAGIASGWKSLAISELPRVFRWYFPPRKRHPFVADAYGPSGAWWLRDRVVDHIDIWLDSRFEAASLENDRVRLRIACPDGNRELVTDHVIAGTGYRVNIDRLDYLSPGLLESIRTEAAGIPSLSSRFETSVPGLFIVGVASAPVFGPIMRFMYGAKHVGPVLANRVR